MYPITKTVTTSKGDVDVYDLTIGYISDIESKVQKDTRESAVLNGTNLTEDELRDYRTGDIRLMFDAIMKLTYPEAYNEDGTLKEIPESVDKKKA